MRFIRLSAIVLISLAVGCVETLDEPADDSAIALPEAALSTTGEAASIALPELSAPLVEAVTLDALAQGIAPVVEVGATDLAVTPVEPTARIIDFTGPDADVEFGGVGMTVRDAEGEIVIIDVLPDLPADRAGLSHGMRVVAVDEMPTEGMTVEQFVALVRGEPGQSVVLTVITDDVETTHELVREAVVVTETRCDRLRRTQRQTEFGAVGIHVAGGCGPVAIEGVEAGMPAAEAGLQVGDRIVTVDGLLTTGTPLWDIVGEIRGEPGTIVTLGVETADGVGRTVELERLTMAIPEGGSCAR